MAARPGDPAQMALTSPPNDDDEPLTPLPLLRDRWESVIPTPGKQIEWNAMPFRLTEAERTRGQLGPPAWSIRLRRMEEWHRRLEAGLRLAAAELAVRELGEAALERQWQEELGRVDLERVNTLIDHHNRYYPVEANLPTDPRTGRLMRGAEPFEREPLLSREWLEARYPVGWARQVGIEAAMKRGA